MDIRNKKTGEVYPDVQRVRVGMWITETAEGYFELIEACKKRGVNTDGWIAIRYGDNQTVQLEPGTPIEPIEDEIDIDCHFSWKIKKYGDMPIFKLRWEQRTKGNKTIVRDYKEDDYASGETYFTFQDLIEQAAPADKKQEIEEMLSELDFEDKDIVEYLNDMSDAQSKRFWDRMERDLWK